MPRRKGEAGSVEDLKKIGLFAQVGNADLAKFARLAAAVEAEPGAIP